MSEEEIIEENIRRYIKEHSTTIKAYTQKYVDDLQDQLQQKENIIKEVREKIESVRIYGLRSGKTLIATLLNDILKIIDKEVN